MRILLAALTLIIGLTACGRAEESFRTIQFCLADAGEIDSMKAVLRQVAAAHDLRFYDNSKETEAAFNEISPNDPAVAPPTVNVGTIEPDRMGFTAGNLGMGPTQIAVGFNKADDDLATARKFSDRVVQGLSQRWHIHEVPAGRGAVPLNDCGANSGMSATGRTRT